MGEVSVTDRDGLFWIECSARLLAAMKFMGLGGYRTCDEAPRRPGGQMSPATAISHFHGVPAAVAATWDQYETEAIGSLRC